MSFWDIFKKKKPKPGGNELSNTFEEMLYQKGVFKNKDLKPDQTPEPEPAAVLCRQNCVSKAFAMAFAAKNMGHFKVRICFASGGVHVWCEALVNGSWKAISDKGAYDVIVTDSVKNGYEAGPARTLTLREFFEQQVNI